MPVPSGKERCAKCAYGLCLVAGLLEVHRIAHGDGLAALTAAYYALTYLGFAAPFLLAVAAHLTSYPILLLITAALALSTACLVARLSVSQRDAQPLRPTVPAIEGQAGARRSL